MDDLSTASFEAQTLPEQISAGWLSDARTFLSGFAMTVVVTALGASLVTVALVVGVVGAPVIAAAIAYVVFRSRRAAKLRVIAT
jgi:hypothetical protein